MPFGLQGAPGVSQEMIKILCAKAEQKLQELGVNYHDIFLGALFDDSDLGTNYQEEHLMVIENNARVKLSKFNFMVEELIIIINIRF